MHRKRRPIVVASESTTYGSTAPVQSNSQSLSTSSTNRSINSIEDQQLPINIEPSSQNDNFTPITRNNSNLSTNVNNFPSTSASCQNLIDS